MTTIKCKKTNVGRIGYLAPEGRVEVVEADRAYFGPTRGWWWCFTVKVLATGEVVKLSAEKSKRIEW